jgi:hypothetical protein
MKKDIFYVTGSNGRTEVFGYDLGGAWFLAPRYSERTVITKPRAPTGEVKNGVAVYSKQETMPDDESWRNAKPCVLTHKKTGLAACFDVNLTQAKRIVQALASLGVVSDSDDGDLVVAELNDKLGPEGIKQLRDGTLGETPRVVKTEARAMLDSIIKSRQWRGAKVVVGDLRGAPAWVVTLGTARAYVYMGHDDIATAGLYTKAAA